MANNILSRYLTEDRVDAADINVPIIVTETSKYGIVVLDGTHRLIKASRKKMTKMPCRFVTEKEIKSYRIN